MNRLYVPFSRGSRMCLGLRYVHHVKIVLSPMDRGFVASTYGLANRRLRLHHSLAYAEMYISLAVIFRRFDLQLYKTYRERDVDLVRDCFVGETAKGSPGVRVTLARKEDET